jgi:hypothetical protein
MRLPPFDHTRKAWDRYNSFHVTHGKCQDHYNHVFVQFETGELTCVVYAFNTDKRGEWPGLGLTTTTTKDRTCPKLYLPDGSEVLTSWLGACSQQSLIIDNETGYVVGLGAKHDQSIPEHMWSFCSVYWAGVHSLPVGGPIGYKKTRRLEPEVREHCNTLKAAARAWYMIQGEQAEVLRMSLGCSAVSTDWLLTAGTIMDLDDRVKVQLSTKGYRSPQEYHKAPYLLTLEGLKLAKATT